MWIKLGKCTFKNRRQVIHRLGIFITATVTCGIGHFGFDGDLGVARLDRYFNDNTVINIVLNHRTLKQNSAVFVGHYQFIADFDSIRIKGHLTGNGAVWADLCFIVYAIGTGIFQLNLYSWNSIIHWLFIFSATAIACWVSYFSFNNNISVARRYGHPNSYAIINIVLSHRTFKQNSTIFIGHDQCVADFNSIRVKGYLAGNSTIRTNFRVVIHVI